MFASVLVTSTASIAAKPPCPPPKPGPDRPQVPVPVPADPPPAWTGRTFARTEAPWFLPLGSITLRIGQPSGALDGYGTWRDAVTAAGVLSHAAASAVAILDHRGRLYLRGVVVTPAGNAFGRPIPYALGVRGERAIVFADDAVRGVVHGDRIVARGDCLLDRVEIPVERPSRD